MDSLAMNAPKSVAIASTAWRAVRAALASGQSARPDTTALRPRRGPGLTRAEAASSSARQAAIHAGSKTPEVRRNSSADSAKVVERISWPPTTKSPGSGSGKSRNGGRAVTNPVRSASPRSIAARPSVIVVPTPPNAPTNQSPTRRRVMLATTCGSGVVVNPGTRIRREAASGLKTKAGKLPRHPPLSSTQTHFFLLPGSAAAAASSPSESAVR